MTPAVAFCGFVQYVFLWNTASVITFLYHNSTMWSSAKYTVKPVLYQFILYNCCLSNKMFVIIIFCRFFCMVTCIL
uniref:Uncharacterized protein n=1 Tax=Anguilla anguilla TaxID=7936 RepID=A0A0E9XGZ6_ANGAN